MDELDKKHARFDELYADILNTAEGDGQIKRPVRLLASLRDCKDSAWDSAWHEAVILVRCMARVKPRRTHGMMAKLQERYTKSGDHEKFKRLEGLVTKILAPDALTPHGYHRTFKSQENDAIFAEIHTSADPLKELDRPVMLYAGGLLGAVRDGKFIDHDDDIDLAVMMGEVTDADIFEVWLDYKKKLKVLDLLAEGEDKLDSPVFRIKSSLFMVELFPSWVSNGKYSVYPYSLAEIDQDKIFPLKKMDDSDIMLPHDADALLEQSYGPNWRTPDPFFHVNWAKQRSRFSFLLKGSYTI